MDNIYTKARAKVNLTLNVLNKRPDNYHNLESIFQKINLYDELYIEKTETNTLEIITNLKNVKLEDNIIFKAYTKLKELSKDICGVKVILNKRIPTEAGMAGGSRTPGSEQPALHRPGTADLYCPEEHSACYQAWYLHRNRIPRPV